jgi:hypothetical protein
MMLKSPMFDEYPTNQSAINSFPLPATAFLPDTPGVLAYRTLPATLAETIYAPSATRRFRV